jgi:monoamine oxidase
MARDHQARPSEQANFPASKYYDVLIVGAGVSGLACARKLLEKNLKILIVESRSRAGGRMLSLHRPGSSLPIELGAEFIHGAPTSTLDLMRTFHLPFYDVLDHHHHWDGHKFQMQSDFFEHISKVNQKIARLQKHDASIGEFLRTQKTLDPDWKLLYKRYIEGFHAANVDLISQQSVASSEDDSELNGSHMFRSVRGYSELIQRLSEELAQKDLLKFNLSVRKIVWEKGDVKVFCHSAFNPESTTLQANKLVMTAPLAILKAPQSEHSGILWDPLPEKLDKILDSMEMGHVQRLVFRFRSRFWEELAGDKAMSFIHMHEDCDFPTWWTMAPMRSVDLVAWQGGPRAREMSLWSRADKIQAALATLSKWTGHSIAWLVDHMQSCHTHDWSRDPHSLGAYSYVKAGGLPLSKQLAEPVTDTLFFAGEATCFGSARGTVHGAIESGYRAAEQILEANLNSFQRPVQRHRFHGANAFI